MAVLRLSGTRLLLVAGALGGCGLPFVPVHAPPECGLPDGAALAYAGETSLAALGLGTDSSGDHAVGRIFVTRDRIPFAGSLPNTPAGPAVVPDQRQYCAVYDDTLSLGSVPDDWAAPRQ